MSRSRKVFDGRSGCVWCGDKERSPGFRYEPCFDADCPEPECPLPRGHDAAEHESGRIRRRVRKRVLKEPDQVSVSHEEKLYASLPTGAILRPAPDIDSARPLDDDRDFYLSEAFQHCEWCSKRELMFQSCLCVRCERFRVWELIAS